MFECSQLYPCYEIIMQKLMNCSYDLNWLTNVLHLKVVDVEIVTLLISCFL